MGYARKSGPDGLSILLLAVIIVVLVAVGWLLLSGDAAWGPTGGTE